jgi:hypothetical protein
MITLIGQLLPLLGLITGLFLGGTLGAARGGLWGSILGALCGAFLGLACGRIPALVVFSVTIHGLKRISTEQLRALVRAEECRAVNIVILVLKSRGEDVHQELDLVLGMLVSIAYDERCRGWAAMQTAFPELAERIADYSPTDPIEVGCAKVARLQADG